MKRDFKLILERAPFVFTEEMAYLMGGDKARIF